MKGQWLAHCQGLGFGQHQGEPMVAQACATKGGVGIGLSAFGEQAGAKATNIMIEAVRDCHLAGFLRGAPFLATPPQ